MHRFNHSSIVSIILFIACATAFFNIFSLTHLKSAFAAINLIFLFLIFTLSFARKTDHIALRLWVINNEKDCSRVIKGFFFIGALLIISFFIHYQRSDLLPSFLLFSASLVLLIADTLSTIKFNEFVAPRHHLKT
jgi:hypothetical protein